MESSDKIAFLPVERSIQFEGGEFVPLPEFAEAVELVQSRIHSDACVYAPSEAPKKWSAGSSDACSTPGAVKWDREDLAPRNALLFHLPASHSISVSPPLLTKASEFREADGAFLLHLVGYLHGIRLQFFDWRFDRRVRIKSSHNIFVHPAEETLFLSHAYAAWRSWTNEQQRLFTNSLYMLVRSSSIEWDWERFSSNYMVFDSLYRSAVTRSLISESPNHKKRLRAMCETFGLYIDDELINQIYELRNPLVHEGLWGGKQPGTLVDSKYFYAFLNLEKINQRLVPALLQYPTGYIASEWKSLGVFPFKKTT